MSFDLVERRQQRPCFQLAAVIGVGSEPQHAAAVAVRRCKLEDRLDGVGARARHPARRGAIRIDRKLSRPCAAGLRRQLVDNSVGAIDRRDAPRQRQHIAPVALCMKQGFKPSMIGFGESLLELCQPHLHGHRGSFCFRQHALRPTIDLRLSRCFNTSIAPIDRGLTQLFRAMQARDHRCAQEIFARARGIAGNGLQRAAEFVAG